MKTIAQKTIGGLMLLIFVLSLMPLALADTMAGYQGDSNSINTSAGTSTQEATTTTANGNSGKTSVQESAATRTAGETTVTSTGIRDKLESDAELKENYLTEKEKYVSDKGELEQLKAQVRDCKEAINTSGCQFKKLELKKGVKIHLVKTIALIEQSFKRLTHRVEASKVLTEEEKTEALARIQELEAKLTAKEDEIKALNADTLTNEQLKAEVKELKALWNDIRTTQRKIITEMINSRHEKMAEMYNRFVERIEAQIQKLQTQGAQAEDIAKLNELLTAFKAKVADIQSAHAAAKQAWLQAKTEHTAEAIDAAHQAQEQVRAAMKEAKMALRQLLQELKTVRASLTLKKAPSPAPAE